MGEPCSTYMRVCLVLETSTPVIELRKTEYTFDGAATVTGSVLSNNTSPELTASEKHPPIVGVM